MTAPAGRWSAHQAHFALKSLRNGLIVVFVQGSCDGVQLNPQIMHMTNLFNMIIQACMHEFSVRSKLRGQQEKGRTV